MAASAPACREALIPSTLQSPQGVGHVEELVGALGARVRDPWRDPKYDSARIRIANAAFLPSRVWNDSSVWSAITSSRRTLLIAGSLTAGRYRLEAARSLSPISQTAESRHVINLTRLAEDEYAWDTDVTYAVGHLTAAESGHVVNALLTAAEGRSERDLRANYSTVAPRASAALARLFHVDSIRATTLADRSTVTTYVVSMHPGGVEASYPNFAKYLRRYAESAEIALSLADRAGTSFVEATMADGRIRLRVRALGGALAPLSPAAPARPLPDSLTLNGALTLKVRRFTVGFRDYHADFTVIRTPRERAWTIVSRNEPHWILPLVTERLLKTPLRRPFDGSGTLFRIGVREDSAGGQTVLHRRLHLEVQESLILRFIGRLGAIAVGDYSGKAEREQYAFLNEFFTALATDLGALHAAPGS